MMNRTRMILLPLFLLGLTTGIFLLLLYLPSHASAEAIFTVNTTTDTDDGTCNGAHCSLREAINAANGTTGIDTITFSLLPSATITLAGAQLPTITDTLIIDGSTAVSLTISGNNLTRTFEIGSGTAVTLTRLMIRDGQAMYGGAIYNNGGILTIESSTLIDNKAFYGGGIYNITGTLTITNSRIFANFAEYGGGGIFNSQFSTAAIQRSTFLDNIADAEINIVVIKGGGILNEGNLTIWDSMFTNNHAIADANPSIPPIEGNSNGGAVSSSGILAVYNSTFNNNLVTGASGPLLNSFSTGYGLDSSAYGGGIHNSGVFTASNSTFSGNRAVAAESFQTIVRVMGYTGGGGVINTQNGTMTLINSTFSENGTERYPWGAGGGGSVYNGGTLHLRNTLIANSDDNVDCVNKGTISTNVNNLVEDGSCNAILTGDPLLYRLQDNGGPTLTHALSSLSIAVDVGDNATCAAGPVNNLDQRGETRPLDGNGDGTPRCDIGAYEYDGPPPDRFYLPGFFHN